MGKKNEIITTTGKGEIVATDPDPVLKLPDGRPFTIPITGAKPGEPREWELRASFAQELACTYVERGKRWLWEELKKARMWAISNPKGRKKNAKRYITNWLSRAADKPSYGPSAEPIEDSDDDKARKLELIRQAKKRGTK